MHEFVETEATAQITPILNMQSFDYSLVEEQDGDFLRGKEIAIKQRTSHAIIENGRDLLEAKARVGHGNFLAWIQGCFPWSQRTARRMMEVAENIKCGKLANLADMGNIHLSALYLLAQPSTPEAAREEAIARVEGGESLTHAQAKELIEAKKIISNLKGTIKALEAQIPTTDVLAQIDKLKVDLGNAVNKPAEVKVVEKIPSDYESLKEQRDALNVEIVTLQKKIKSITKNHNDEVDSKVNAKIGELRGSVAERERHLEQVKNEIDKLYVVRNQLDSDVGDIAASQETCKIVRRCLLEISIALHNLLDDHSIHPDCERDIEDLCEEMVNGAVDFRRYLNNRPGGETVEVSTNAISIIG